MPTDEVLVTVAGARLGARGYVDGTGYAARFHQPLDIAVDSTDTYLYVADYGNFAVRRVEIDTGVVDTVAVLDASPNCLMVDADGLLWVNTVGPSNDNYVYEVATPLDAAAEFTANAKVPNRGGANPEAMWCFEADGNLLFRVDTVPIAVVGPFAGTGVAGSFTGGLYADPSLPLVPSYDPITREGYGVSYLQRNAQSGRRFGGAQVNQFSVQLGLTDYLGFYDQTYDPGFPVVAYQNDLEAFDLDHGFWAINDLDPADVTFHPYLMLDTYEDPPEPDCPVSPCGPTEQLCNLRVPSRDGAYSANCGLVSVLAGQVATGSGYVYPSSTGMRLLNYYDSIGITTTSLRFPDAYCDCEDETLPCPPPPSSGSYVAHINWSDAFVVDDFDAGKGAWGNNHRVGWQLTRGEVFDDNPFECEIGLAKYQVGGASPGGSSFLQTFNFRNCEDIDDPVHRGKSPAPVRGAAYSPSRSEWFFTTSATSNAYGPYTKLVDGTASGYGFHQVMRMVDYVEVDTAVDYSLGGVTATWSDARSTIGAGVLPPTAGSAVPSGLVLPSPGTVERIPPIDPFVPDPNPMPPDPDEIEVPLPPWLPDGGPYRNGGT